MAVNLSPIWGAGAQLLDNSGNVLSGGKIYTYYAGTTTPSNTFTSSSGNTPNSNPIILNSAGRVPYEIWLSDGASYKFVLKDSNDTLIGTWDNLVGINSNFVNYVNQQEIQIATAGQTVFTLATMQYLPGTNSLSVYVDGVNQYGPGAQYAFVETDAVTVTFASGLHVGAEVKFTSTQTQNSGVADASQISYTYPSADAVTESVEDRLAQYVSVKDFGAVGDGVTDDAVAIQNAIDGIADGSELVFPSGEIYAVGSQIVIDKPMTIKMLGTVKPAVNAGTAGTGMFKITSSDVTIDGNGIGTFDFVSSSYSNWGAIYAATTTRLENVNVINCNFDNVGIDSTAAFVVNFDGVDGGSMVNNKLSNCGVIGNVGGGGFGLYMQFCNYCTVSENVLKYVGSTGINDSAGNSNVITNNHVSYATLFGFKGGYAPNVTTITADVTPTVYTFSVSATSSAVKNLVDGASFEVFNSSYPPPIGQASKVVNHGTYLQVFLSDAPLDAAPVVGSEVQMLQNGTVYSNNTLFVTGENGWDINGWTNLIISNNFVYSAGSYTDVGTFGGLSAGIWLGYDPQGGYNKMRCSGATINGNLITNSYGSGISIMSTIDNVNISGNTIINANRIGSTDFGSIEVCRLGYYRSGNHSITGNTCIGGFNYGIFSGYSTNSIVANNQIKTQLGICVNSQQNCNVTGNVINATSSASTAYGIQVQDASTTNPSSGVVIQNNNVTVNGGTCIKNTDTGFTFTNIKDTNFTSGAVGYVDFATVTSFVNEVPNTNAGSYSSQVDKKIAQYATGNSLTFDPILQDNFNMYFVTVSLDTGANTGVPGLYLISSTGTSKYVTAIHAATGVTVSVTTGKQIKVENVSGGSATISASLRMIH